MDDIISANFPQFVHRLVMQARLPCLHIMTVESLGLDKGLLWFSIVIWVYLLILMLHKKNLLLTGPALNLNLKSGQIWPRDSEFVCQDTGNQITMNEPYCSSLSSLWYIRLHSAALNIWQVKSEHNPPNKQM